MMSDAMHPGQRAARVVWVVMVDRDMVQGGTVEGPGNTSLIARLVIR